MITLSPWGFIVLTLAVYRVAYLITREDGPLDLFAKLRGWLDPRQQTWIGRGLNCILCVSFWIGLLGALLVGASWLEWLAVCGAIVLWREVIAR